MKLRVDRYDPGFGALAHLTWIVGSPDSKDRSRTSSASASDTRRLARHWTMNRSAAREFGAAGISASTSWGFEILGQRLKPVFGSRSLRILSPGLSVSLDGGGLRCQARLWDLDPGKDSFSE